MLQLHVKYLDFGFYMDKKKLIYTSFITKKTMKIPESIKDLIFKYLLQLKTTQINKDIKKTRPLWRFSVCKKISKNDKIKELYYCAACSELLSITKIKWYVHGNTMHYRFYRTCPYCIYPETINHLGTCIVSFSSTKSFSSYDNLEFKPKENIQCSESDVNWFDHHYRTPLIPY